MKRFICCLMLVFTVAAGYSQKVYFVFLQSETEQPFSVKMDERIYNSSGPGYLILSKLHDSSYSFTLSFPQNKWPEQKFTVDIRGRDRGFVLKNFGEKGWGLFDLQTLSVLMSVIPSVKTASTETVEVSAFTDILSRAANDPSLREKPIAARQPEHPVTVQPAVVKEEVKEKETVAKNVDLAVKKDPQPVTKEKEKPAIETAKKTDATVKKDEPVAVNTEKPKDIIETVKTDPVVRKEEPPVLVAKQDPVVKKEETVTTTEPVAAKKEETVAPPEYKPSIVKRRSESSTTEGFGLTFVDEYPDGKKDTIRIVIPPSRSMGMVVKEPSKEDKKFLDITSDSKDVSTATKPVETTKKNVPVKCAAADDNDFLKLRKRMAGQTKDESMISEAAKYFKSKCFSVFQVKNLSTLFLNDAGKFKFFDAASGHITDAENFGALQSELKDQAYIDRFKSIHP